MHSGGAGADIRSRLDKKAMLINLLLLAVILIQPYRDRHHDLAAQKTAPSVNAVPVTGYGCKNQTLSIRALCNAARVPPYREELGRTPLLLFRVRC
jgi:hypothetical protein